MKFNIKLLILKTFNFKDLAKMLILLKTEYPRRSDHQFEPI